MPSKRETLRAISFGQRVAEEEIEELSEYFVETELWRRIFAGEIDIVYGPKGAGKSAMYGRLLSRKDELGLEESPSYPPRIRAAQRRSETLRLTPRQVNGSSLGCGSRMSYLFPEPYSARRAPAIRPPGRYCVS